MRILLTAWPAWGHLLPMLPLARAARADGHEVVITTGPELADAVRRRGFDVWAQGPTAAEAEVAVRAAVPDYDAVPLDRRIPLALTHFFGPANSLRADGLLPRVLDWRPDVVINNPGDVAGAVIAERTGARHVLHGVGPTPLGLDGLVPLITAAAKDRFGIDDLDERILAAPLLDISPPGLAIPGAGWPGPTRPLRPEAGPPDPDPAIERLIRGLPHDRTVYLTLGTIFNGIPGVLETALAGISSLGLNVVVTTGPGVDPGRLHGHGPHVLVRQHIAQASVLPHSDAIVGHAGAGTVLGALSHGLPQLSLPLGAEQPLNAAALEHAGAGLTLTRDEITPAAVAGSLARLLDEPAFVRAARGLREEIEAMPSATEVVRSLADQPAAVP